MKVTVVGIGFNGLINAIGFAAKGHEVFALDPDKKKIAALRRNETPIVENKLQEELEKNADKIRFTSEFRDAIYGATVIVVCSEVYEKEVGKYAHTPHQCSCDMCCNKRNVNGCQKDKLSLQEKRADLDLKEELNEDKENK